MKKSLFIILAIFIIPIALYLILSAKTESNVSLATGGNILVYKFMSPMCSECKNVQKIVEKLDDKYDYVVFQEVNVGGSNASKDDVKRLIKQYDVTVVPTLVFLDHKGNFHKKIEVDMTEEDVKKVLDKLDKKRKE